MNCPIGARLPPDYFNPPITYKVDLAKRKDGSVFASNVTPVSALQVVAFCREGETVHAMAFERLSVGMSWERKS